MQYSKSEITSALHQNGGGLRKTLRFLSLYHEELAGAKNEDPKTPWRFSEGVIPPYFAEAWESFFQVPFIKEILELYVGNAETISVADLKKDFGTDDLDAILEEIRSRYSRHLFEDIELGILLGEGSFGDVYLTKQTNSNIQYAAKLFDSDNERYYTRETKILSFVSKMNIITQESQNRNVVGWWGSLESLKFDTRFAILTEFVEGVTLGETGFKAWERWAHFPYIVWQLFSGLDFLHKKGVAHSDIKLENLMLQPATADSDGRLVIIDLGLACVFDRERAEAFDREGAREIEDFNCADLGRAGSAEYFSPQKARVFSYERDQPVNKYVEEKADLWAAALTIVCFLTAKDPKLTLYQHLYMDEFEAAFWATDTLEYLLKYDDDRKLQEVSYRVTGSLQKFYVDEIEGKIDVKSMKETFWGDCTIILSKLGYIFRRYTIETAEGILDHLNVDNSQGLFFPNGKVKDGAGVFDKRS